MARPPAIEGEIIKRAKLTPKQERFCQLYATDKEFFGNGLASYVEAYQPNRLRRGWYSVAGASASRLLKNVKVSQRINQLLERGGLNDEFVDKQLLFLITQHSDWNAKMAAIREYNKLKGRITDKLKVEAELKIKAVEVMPVGSGSEATADGDIAKAELSR